MSYLDIVDLYDKIFPFNAAKVEFLQSYFPTGSTILDLGCGIGNYTAALCELGYNCIGFDIDPDMIAKAKKNHPDLQFINASLEALPDFEFSGAFCFGNTLSYLSPQKLNNFLKNLKSKLNGTWIYQTVNWDYVLTYEKFGFTDVYLTSVMEPDPQKFRRWYEPISASGVIFHRQMMFGREVMSHATDQLYPLTQEQSTKQLESAGFKSIEFFADFTKSEFKTNKDTSLIGVANSY